MLHKSCNRILNIVKGCKSESVHAIPNCVFIQKRRKWWFRSGSQFFQDWDEETKTYHAMHHPFTSPKTNQIDLIDSDPSAVRADAYGLVLNGNEIGGGSIRIHDKKIQQKMFDCLGFTKEEADKQFGFLMNAFEYGAPPHGGIAFGLDRLVAIMGGNEIIRDFIAFPKNNSGRDIMIDSPSSISEEQLKEINLKKRS